MAGAQKDEPGDLSQGRVQAVRKQWAVHEDGALAIQIQNEEITEHYGLNRFHRRMVREDIPVAKFVQSAEELQQQEERLKELEVLKIQSLRGEVAKVVQSAQELQQQEERLKELEVLKIQAEEDAKLAQKISRHMKRESRNRAGYENRHHGPREVRNYTDHEVGNHTDHEVGNYEELNIGNHGEYQIQDHEIRNSTDHEIRNRTDNDVGNHQEHVVGNHGDHQIKSRTDHDVRTPTFHDVRNPTFHDVRNYRDHDVRRQMENDVRNYRDHDVRSHADDDVSNHLYQEARNRAGNEVRHRADREVLDDEELARQLQEKERRKYERHLERKKEKKLKKERQVLEAALAKDVEDARLAVSPENGGDGVSASMESLNLQGVSVTRITAGGQIEDNGDFSDFYKLPDEMDEVTRMEIQASQDEELARLLQEQEHKRTKAKVDPEKMRRIELHDQQLARIIQEEEKLKMRKAKQKHQARKEARRLLTGEALPLGASANSLNQQKQSQECLADPPPAAVPAVSSGQQRYRSNSYTKACDSPPSPARSPARKHRASPRVGEDPAQPRVPSHESIAPSGGPDHKHQHYPKSLNERQASTSSSTSSPIAAQSSSGRGLSTLETARQIAAGNPEGILAIQNSHKNTGDRKRRTEQDRFMRSQEMLDIDRLPVQGQHTGRSARRGSDPYRQVTEVRSDAAVYALPYKPHGVLLGSELRQLEVADVHGYLTDESGSSSGSVSRLSRLHQDHQYHQQQQLQQQQGDSLSQEDAGPQIHPAPTGLAEFNIVAALDPTYQRRHPEARLLPETQIQSQVPFSRSLPQADGELEWDPNLRGSLRKPKAQVHGYHDPTTIGSLGHVNAVGGEPVMSSWQPVQGQRRRDPGTRGRAQPRNASGGDKRGNCKQQ